MVCGLTFKMLSELHCVEGVGDENLDLDTYSARRLM
jgi:hypothetical protein